MSQFIEPDFLPDPTYTYLNNGYLCLEYRWLGTGKGAFVRCKNNKFQVWRLEYNDSLGAFEQVVSTMAILSANELIAWLEAAAEG